MVKGKVRFLPFGIWLIVIALLCLTPGNNLPRADFFNFAKADKWVHAFLYLVLFITFQWGVTPSKSTYLLSINILIIAVLGFLIELLQHMVVKDRYGDVDDWVANMIGVPLGIIVWKLWKKEWPW